MINNHDRNGAEIHIGDKVLAHQDNGISLEGSINELRPDGSVIVWEKDAAKFSRFDSKKITVEWNDL